MKLGALLMPSHPPEGPLGRPVSAFKKQEET
jgi:hypothetical protein